VAAVIWQIHGHARWFTSQFCGHSQRRSDGLAAAQAEDWRWWWSTVVVVGQTPLINIYLLIN